MECTEWYKVVLPYHVASDYTVEPDVLIDEDDQVMLEAVVCNMEVVFFL